MCCLAVIVLMVASAFLSPVALPTAAAEGVWSSLGPEGGTITALAIDPVNAETLYAGTLDGIYRSIDGAGTWQKITAGAPLVGQVNQILMSPASPSTMYVHQYASAQLDGPGTVSNLLRSDDGGSHWTVITPDSSMGPSWGRITLDSFAPGTVYVVGYRVENGWPRAGVLKSINGGISWSPADSGLPTDVNLKDILVSPHSSNVLYGGAYGVYTSQDAGATWTAGNTGLPQGPDGQPLPVLMVAADPINAGVVFARTAAGLHKSIDNGASWSSPAIGYPAPINEQFDAGVLVFDPGVSGRIYAATGSGVFKSVDGGSTWTQVSQGIPGSSTLVNLAIDRLHPSTLYFATNIIGVYKSENGGTSWAPANDGLRRTTLSAVAIAPSQPAVVYAGALAPGGVYRSPDRGVSWSVQGVNDAVLNWNVQALAVHPSQPGTVFAGTSAGLFVSTDAGQSWSRSGTGIPTVGSVGPSITTLAIHPTTPSTIYAGGHYFGIYRSTDGGATWLPGANIQNASIYDLRIDPTMPSTIYAVGPSFHVSADGGITWTFGGIGPSYALALDPTTPGTVYVGGPDGVRKSVNGGTLWDSYGTGLPSSPDVRSLVIDPRDARVLYAGTRLGVYWTTNSGQTWGVLGTGLPPTSVRSFAIDASAGTLYAATSGFGLYAIQLPNVAPATPTATHTATPTATVAGTNTPTPTVTPMPSQCAPRPPISVQTVPNGDGRLRATLSATSNAGMQNELRTVTLGQAANATVQIPGVGPVQSGQRVPLAPGTQTVSLLVTRIAPGQHATVPLTVSDLCGDWSTIVGGGVNGF